MSDIPVSGIDIDIESRDRLLADERDTREGAEDGDCDGKAVRRAPYPYVYGDIGGAGIIGADGLLSLSLVLGWGFALAVREGEGEGAGEGEDEDESVVTDSGSSVNRAGAK